MKVREKWEVCGGWLRHADLQWHTFVTTIIIWIGLIRAGTNHCMMNMLISATIVQGILWSVSVGGSNAVVRGSAMRGRESR